MILCREKKELLHLFFYLCWGGKGMVIFLEVLFYRLLSWNSGSGSFLAGFLLMEEELWSCASRVTPGFSGNFLEFAGICWNFLGIFWEFAQFAVNCWDFLGIAGICLEFLKIGGNYWEFAGDFWDLLGIAGIFWELLEFSGNLLRFAGNFWELQGSSAGGAAGMGDLGFWGWDRSCHTEMLCLGGLGWLCPPSPCPAPGGLREQFGIRQEEFVPCSQGQGEATEICPK